MLIEHVLACRYWVAWNRSARGTGHGDPIGHPCRRETVRDGERHPSGCQLREAAESLVSRAASIATDLPQMQEQPRAEGRRRGQRAYGPQQALEMIGIA